MRKMSKQAWEDVKAPSGGKYLLDIGAYICAIKDYRDFEENEYVSFDYDVVEGDDSGFFTKMYKADSEKYGDKAFWKGSFTRNYSENSESYWKAFVTSVEKSNKNFTWNPESPNLDNFKNKYIGLIVGQKEYTGNNGKVYKRNYVDSIHSVERIKSGDYQLPELKKLDETKVSTKEDDSFVDPFASAVSNNADVANDSPFNMDEPSPFDNL